MQIVGLMLLVVAAKGNDIRMAEVEQIIVKMNVLKTCPAQVDHIINPVVVKTENTFSGFTQFLPQTNGRAGPKIERTKLFEMPQAPAVAQAGIIARQKRLKGRQVGDRNMLFLNSKKQNQMVFIEAKLGGRKFLS